MSRAQPNASRRGVIIVGGGLAGMACALRLAERGLPVTVLETRKKLGGRATSFTDVRTNQVLDNCQHVVLGCCTNYLDLLQRLDRADRIRWHTHQYWLEAGGRLSTLRRSALPAPTHYALSLAGAAFLSSAEKLLLTRACLAIMRTQRTRFTHQTFAQYLTGSLGQTDRLLRRFWSPVVISACNLDVDRVAASSALHVFQEGFFAAARSADIGVPTVPLVELYELAADRIAAAGGEVRLGVGVESLTARTVTTTVGEVLSADVVVCAVPVERVLRLIAETDRQIDPRFDALSTFTHSPILGVHLEFDRPPLGELPHAVLVDRPTQWLFAKDPPGKLHAVISAADAWLELDEQQIADRVMDDLRTCLPSFQASQGRARDAQPKLLRVRAVKEKLATFAPVPGLDALRPGPTGPSGIILAGDYTSTGWPATMEGATRSGYVAAAAVLGLDPRQLVMPPLAAAPLSRLLGVRTGRATPAPAAAVASIAPQQRNSPLPV
jgi:squalene-associated FAD-dependent desaturase